MEPWLERFALANFRRSADTAHDLKTPLNIAVLNLELLRMRLAKLGCGEDPKAAEHARAIESELRRLARIFDAFFLLSVPPKDDQPLARVDALALCEAAARTAGIAFERDGVAEVQVHEARINEMFRMFFEGAQKHLGAARARAASDAGVLTVTLEGDATDELEIEKLFKFYYTDSEGNPDLSLPVARLIAETYGGDLTSTKDEGRAAFRLVLPLGATGER